MSNSLASLAELAKPWLDEVFRTEVTSCVLPTVSSVIQVTTALQGFNGL